MEISELEQKIDGLLIPGGRDINPKYYNENNNGTNLNRNADKRFIYMKNLYE